jgi:class 3 adenylate cyclase
MPIFMDRHEMEQVTAEIVAEAHKADLAIQSKHGCKAITYWFDGERSTAFCLVEAPNADAVLKMHREAHGDLPTQIMEVDPNTVAAFLGRVVDPPGDEPVNEAAFRAIMFTDMAQSTETTSALGDAAAYALLQTHHEIILGAVSAHEGSEVDRAGDGFLLSFPAVTRAVACAIEVQRRLADHNARDNGSPIRVRIGLGAGEPVTDGKALFGSVVNLTARICSEATPGQILTSDVVRELSIGKDFEFVDRGSMRLKGFDAPVRLHEVVWGQGPP